MPPTHAERQIEHAHRPMPGGSVASLNSIFAKARRSLPAPKTKAQAQRRAGLYDRVAEGSGNGPVSRIARMEASRQTAFAQSGKYGRGMTPGRADEEKDRTGAKAASKVAQDRSGGAKRHSPPGAQESRQAPPNARESASLSARLARADKEHADASRRAAAAEDAYAGNRKAGIKAAGAANRTGDRKPLDAVLTGRALTDKERQEALTNLRAARAKLDAVKESARIAALGTPEQVRARADRVMNTRLATLDAGIKARKDQFAARQAEKERERRALDVGPAIGEDRSGDPKRKKPPVKPVRKSTLNAIFRKARGAEPEEVATSFTFAFEKMAKTGRYVAGWASVVEIDGKPVVDHQGDLIEMQELRKSAHDFVTNARAAKAMHDGDPIGDVVESVLIDDDFAKAHGITHGKRGWWIGMEIRDPATQERIRKGELKAFSIGGSGRRTPIL